VAKGKFSEEQILGVVKQLEAGRTAAEMAREVGGSTFTINSWKAKYGGMEPNEAQRLHHLEDENSRLKRLVADLSLDREMLKALLTKKRTKLVERRADAAFLMEQFAAT
jgi:putative transposase